MTAWLVLGLFVLFAVATLDVEIASICSHGPSSTCRMSWLALPSCCVGVLASAFLRRSVTITAVNAGLSSGRLLGLGAQAAVLMLATAMALEHLGVGQNVILASFVILFGGLVLALALAFGLAGRELAKELLERIFTRSLQGGPDEHDDPRRHL